MRRFRVPGTTPSTALGMSRGEKRKLALMILAAGFVAVAFGTTLLRSRATDQDPRVPADDDPPEEVVALPDIDPAALDGAVRDAEEVDRVVLEGAALDALLPAVRRLTPRHFEALEARPLDAEGAARIAADPSAARGQAFVLRGWVESLRSRHRSPTAPEEHVGRMVLEDGTDAHFLVLEKSERMVMGDFVRVDGLFLKLFSAEGEEPGRWVEGPLIVGPRAIRSYPDFGRVESLDPSRMTGLGDDVLFRQDGSQGEWSGIPFEPLWHLMAHARDVPAGAVDWEAAPELDATVIREITAGGEPFRGRPFRIPISRLQGVRVLRAGENPARIEEYTAGWIGNTTWRNVIHFQTPAAHRDLGLSDFVTARGFFLKNFAYESAGKGVHLAPVFVLHSLDRFEPPEDRVFLLFVYSTAGLTVVLAGVFLWLLARDKRRSQRLQEDLVRRRRARRERQRLEDAGADPAAP